MKRFLIICILGLLGVEQGFSRIIYDQKENDSTRVVSTDMTTCRSFTDTQVLNVGMQQIIVNNDTAFYVCICVNQLSDGNIPTDGRMLLKNKNGEVIELHSSTSTKSSFTTNLGRTTNAYRVGSTLHITSHDNSIKTNQVIGYYPVDYETLKKIFIGIEKVRIEINPKNYEKSFGKDKVGKALEKHFNELKELKHDSFHDNF